jgi:DNA-directed RNA polymerase subunit N (RpoN/RPB10)
VAEIRCISCGYDLSAHTLKSRRGVLCPECGTKDAARFPTYPPVSGPLFFLAVWGVVFSVWMVLSAFRTSMSQIVVSFLLAGFALLMAMVGCRRMVVQERWWGRGLIRVWIVGFVLIPPILCWIGLLVRGALRWM